ncbi:MAG: TolC family protein [Bacteroidales bacterium]|nr:TolC family protein [Bacteroidales bacterium]
MLKRFIIILFLTFMTSFVSSQGLQEFLNKVSDNNPEILAYRKLLEAKKIEARTGLTPSNPEVTAGYMPGNSDAIGIKKTWSVTQSFAFPSKYLLQKKISKNTIALVEQEVNYGMLLILLEAKTSMFDLIYNNKVLNVLEKRKEGYDRLRTAWGTMLENGETTILEYNKIILELSALNLEITRRETEIGILKEKLLYMSGGKIPVPEIDYYPDTSEPELDKLISEKSGVHPAFLIPETEYLISLEEVKLSRTGSLPEFQIGYASEIIPGETYSGPVGGITIPLWANSNKVKTAQASVIHLAAVRDAEIFKLKSRIRNEYANMKALKKSMSEVENILESNGEIKYLDIALSNGEISLTSYFSYLEVAFRTEDLLLELKNEYHNSLASLLDYELIK